MQSYLSRIYLSIALLAAMLLPLTAQAGYVDVGAGQPPAEIDGPASAVYLPFITNNADFSLGTPLFGVQLYNNSGSNSPYHPYLLGSGASWLRIDISWNSIEPVSTTPPSYNWNSADNALAAARADLGGLAIIATINNAPPWALANPGASNGPIRQDRLSNFAQFVGALVERYDGDGVADAPHSPRVLHWEFYNEPDAGTVSGYHARWGHFGAAYAQMLAAVYPAVKAANPHAQVVLGGVAYDWFEEDGGPFVRHFMDDVLAAGGGPYFDVMNFHYYPGFSPNWTTTQGPGLLEKTEFMRALLQGYGLDKPMMITETGWHDNELPDLPASPEIQARYVVELLTQSMAARADVMIWWMLHDAGDFYPYNTGLVSNAPAPQEKLAYGTYRLAVAQLGTAHFVRALTPAETGDSDIEVFQFVDNVHNRHTYVAWLDPIDTTEIRPLRLPAHQATVRDSVNNGSYPVTDGGDGLIDGLITIQVSGRPVYVEINR
jgi:hypothetical protein